MVQEKFEMDLVLFIMSLVAIKMSTAEGAYLICGFDIVCSFFSGLQKSKLIIKHSFEAASWNIMYLHVYTGLSYNLTSLLILFNHGPRYMSEQNYQLLIEGI